MKQSSSRKSKALSTRSLKHIANANRKSNVSSVVKSARSSFLNQSVPETIKEIKIVYSEHIKENRKSMDIYLKVKKQMEASGKCKRKTEEEISAEFEHLKRYSIGKETSNLVEELNPEKLSSLSPIECKILANYPNISFIAHRSPSIIVHPIIEELGTYCGCRVSKVAIELSECHELFGERKYRSDGTKKNVIEHAIIIETDSAKSATRSSKRLQEKAKELKVDKYVRVYLGEAI